MEAEAKAEAAEAALKSTASKTLPWILAKRLISLQDMLCECCSKLHFQYRLSCVSDHIIFVLIFLHLCFEKKKNFGKNKHFSNGNPSRFYEAPVSLPF